MKPQKKIGSPKKCPSQNNCVIKDYACQILFPNQTKDVKYRAQTEFFVSESCSPLCFQGDDNDWCCQHVTYFKEQKTNVLLFCSHVKTVS